MTKKTSKTTKTTNNKDNSEKAEKKQAKVLKHAVHKELKQIISHLDKDDLSNYVRYLKSPWRIWWSNLFAGLARGLGFVVGATVLVSVVVYFFINFLVKLPWVGETFEWVSDNVNLEQIQGMGNSLGKLIELQERQATLLEELANKL